MSNPIRSTLLSLALFTCVISAANAQNLLMNGSFEEGNFVPNGDATMSLQPGSTVMTGWETFSGELAWIDNANPFQTSASDGSKHLDLAGYHDAAPYGGVRQTVTTEAGKTYALSFDMGSNPIYGNTISVLASAGNSSATIRLVTQGTGQQWQRKSLNFTAGSDSTLISLQGVVPSGAHIGLDNVSVSLVPAPGALLTMCLGVIPGITCLRRRKSR